MQPGSTPDKGLKPHLYSDSQILFLGASGTQAASTLLTVCRVRAARIADGGVPLVCTASKPAASIMFDARARTWTPVPQMDRVSARACVRLQCVLRRTLIGSWLPCVDMFRSEAGTSLRTFRRPGVACSFRPATLAAFDRTLL